MLHSLKHISHQEWEHELLNTKTGKSTVPESYEEIVKKVNKWKIIWKTKSYKKDYTPYLEAILDGLENPPEKKFETINVHFPDEYYPRTAYLKCESLKEVKN